MEEPRSELVKLRDLEFHYLDWGDRDAPPILFLHGFSGHAWQTIFPAQVLAEDHWVMEDDRGTGRRVKPRPLRWGFKDDPIGRPLREVYAALIAMRNAHPGLRSDDIYPEWNRGWNQLDPQGYGVHAARGVVIYHRWGHDQNGRRIAAGYAILESSQLGRAVTLDEVLAGSADRYQREIDQHYQLV